MRGDARHKEPMPRRCVMMASRECDDRRLALELQSPPSEMPVQSHPVFVCLPLGPFLDPQCGCAAGCMSIVYVLRISVGRSPVSGRGMSTLLSSLPVSAAGPVGHRSVSVSVLWLVPYTVVVATDPVRMSVNVVHKCQARRKPVSCIGHGYLERCHICSSVVSCWEGDSRLCGVKVRNRI